MCPGWLLKEKGRVIILSLKKIISNYTFCCRTNSLGSNTDPNETAVPDGRDFKQLKTISGFSNLYADVSFYAAPSFDGFFFYVNTDWTNKAEVLIKCHPANFEIYKETGPGLYTNKVYTGTPKISGSTYSLVIPWSTAFGTVSSVQTWLYDMTGGDRLPDPPVVK